MGVGVLKPALANIVGQELARKILFKAASGGKISQAYMFKGPAGVGKRTMALAFAAFINCRDKGSDACGRCPSCKKFASNNHPDFMEIVPEGAAGIKIDQIRDLKSKLAFPSFEAAHRVILLADIQSTIRRPEVANSLLKTLEEPPADTIFILTVDEAAEVLATIASRCQVVPFYSLPLEFIRRRLEAEGLEPAAAAALSAISGGSLGRAIAPESRELLALRRQVVELLIYDLSGPLPLPELFRLAETCAGLKDKLAYFFELLGLWLRDLMLFAVPGQEQRMVNIDLVHLYQARREGWQLAELSDKLQALSLARKQLRFNCDRRLVCEVLFLRLSALP